MESRFDVFYVNAPRRDANDFLIVDSTPTRSGVFKYRDSLGNEWGELRHPDDVFSKETLDSLNGIPYTTQENHVALFTTHDAKKKTYGFTLSGAERVDNHARVPIKVLDQSEIDAIEDKTNLELSAGYRCDVINESGIFNNEKYDKRQKNIRYNHVARVTNARGGETCRIRLDSESAICGIEADRIDSESVSKTNNGESIMNMVKRKVPAVQIGDFRLDSEPVEIPADYEGVVDRLEKRQETLADALREKQEKIDSLNADIKKNEAKIDVLTTENSDLKEANKNSIPAEKLDSAVKERAKYLKYADDYGVKDAEDKTNSDIVKEIVKKSGKIKDVAKLDNESYLHAAFDMLDHEYEKKKIQSVSNLEQSQSGEKKTYSFDEARKRRI